MDLTTFLYICRKCGKQKKPTEEFCETCRTLPQIKKKNGAKRLASQQKLSYLGENQQERVFRSFEHARKGMAIAQIDDNTRHAQIASSRATLQQYESAGFLKNVQLQEAMLEYLRIREHEEALHLPATPVPELLLPYFQNISHAGLQKIFKRLGFITSSFVPSLSQEQPLIPAIIMPEQPKPIIKLITPQPQGALDRKSPQLIDTGSKHKKSGANMQASLLGKDMNTGNLVTLKQEARLRGLYVIGKTGSGKTTLLINLILQDIEQGMGVCFFDTHGDPINAILARLPSDREDDVILLDPLDKDSTFGLNLFQCDQTDEEQVSRTVSYVLEVFAKLFTKEGDFSTEAPNMELTLRNSAYTLIDNLAKYGTTMAELPLLIDDEEARTHLIQNIASIHSEPMRFWNRYNRIKQDERDRITSSAYSRVNRFLTNVFIKQVVGQSITTLNFRKIMDEQKIVLVKLSRRDRELTNLIGSIIIGQIANAAFSREDIPEDERVQFNLYADEYQRFATPTFAELLAEVRKYRIATCVAHQWRQQLDVDNRKATLNAGTMVVFEVTGEDAEELAKQFEAKPQPTEPRIEMTRTPITDVLGWLSSGRAHPDPKVNSFMKKVFTPMIQTIRQHHGFPQGQEAQEAYDYLNHFFYKIMLEADKYQQEIKSGNPSENALLSQEMGKTIEPDNATFYLHLDPIPLDVFFAMVKHSEFRGRFRDIIELLERAQSGDFGNVRNPDEVKKPAQELLDSFPKLWGMDYDLNIYILDNAFFYYARGQSLYDPQITTRKEQEAAFAIFIQEFKDFINGLFFSPIMDASGHYEERPGLPEPIANAQARVAQELANPTKKFTARVKLGSGAEHTIEIEETEQFRPAAALSDILSRQLKIVDQTRLNYCKKRVDIEQEIASRQEELTRIEKKQAKARTGDEVKLSPEQLEKIKNIQGN